MTGETPAVAAKRAVKQALNGATGEPHPIHIEPNVAMRRPYILESGSFYKRLEADLNYADTELEMVRVNQAALAQREADLMAVRDAALAGLASIQARQIGYAQPPEPQDQIAGESEQ